METPAPPPVPAPRLRDRLRYLLLLGIKVGARAFYRHRVTWIEPIPPPPWDDLRLLAILNHTSLYEWLYAGAAPNHLLKRIAYRALVPAADITISRPLVGRYFKMLAPEMISITREPDHTWKAVLSRVGPDRMVVILPEGRMMRANGLDKHGQPMTVRGGIADILRAIPEGRMLLAYSGGLHHVHAPGDKLPRIFKTLRIAFEVVDIADYKRAMGGTDDPPRFKRAVKADLETRRDRYCR